MLYVNSRLFVFDNSGAKRVKCIRTPFKNIPAYLGSIVLLSVLSRDPSRRKIRVGQIHRAVVITRGFKVRRFTGHEAGFINGVVLLKKNDNIPISKRVKGPVCVELRQKRMMKILTMGPFAY